MSYEGQAAYIEPQDFQMVIDNLEGTTHAIRNRCALMLGYFTGMRVGSMAQLTLADILNKDGSLKQVVNLRSKTVKKKKKGYRIFLARDEVRKAILDYLKVRPASDKTDTLFVSQKGGAFTPDTLQKLIYRLFEDAGLDGASSHSLRRSFASNALHSGADIVALQTLMAHENINTTQRYVHTDDRMLADVVRNII